MSNNSKEAQELFRLKDRIETAKTEKARVEGELNAIKKTMKDEFGTDDPKKIQTKVTALRDQVGRLREQITEGLAVLREELGE